MTPPRLGRRAIVRLHPISCCQQHAFADPMTEVAIGYPHSPLNGPALHGSSGPKPGERVVPTSGEVRVGSGGQPWFALFAEQNEGTAALIAQSKGLLDTQVRAPSSKEGIWLVRPGVTWPAPQMSQQRYRSISAILFTDSRKRWHLESITLYVGRETRSQFFPARLTQPEDRRSFGKLFVRA